MLLGEKEILCCEVRWLGEMVWKKKLIILCEKFWENSMYIYLC